MGFLRPHILRALFTDLGLILFSEDLRRRFRGWHRWLGRIQMFNVLLLVTPAACGWHSMLNQATSQGVALEHSLSALDRVGWTTAFSRRFADYRRWMERRWMERRWMERRWMERRWMERRWMERCFALLCSAVFSRIIAGAAKVADFTADWIYPFAAWFSWLAPLIILETFNYLRRRIHEEDQRGQRRS